MSTEYSANCAYKYLLLGHSRVSRAKPPKATLPFTDVRNGLGLATVALPAPVSRTKNNTELNWDHLHGAAVYEPLLKPDGSWVVREHHYIENHFARAGLSGPPLHIHRLQDEFFKVERGVLAVVKNGVEHRLTKDDGVLTIPAGTRHRFWVHESTPENVIFDVWLDPCEEVH